MYTFHKLLGFSWGRLFFSIYQISMPLRSLAAIIAFNTGIIMAGGFDALLMVFGSAAIMSTYCAAAVYNNIKDIEGDIINASERPLANRSINLSFAWTLMFFYAALGFLFSIIAHPLVLIADFLWISLGFVYSKYTKSKFMFSYATLVTTHLIIPIATGYLIFSQHTIFLFSILIFLYLTEILSISVKDFKDVKGDKKLGVKTLPVVFTPTKASQITFVGMCIPIVLVWFPWYIYQLSIQFLLIFLFASIIKAALGFKLMKDPNKQNSSSILKKFRYAMLLQTISWCFC